MAKVSVRGSPNLNELIRASEAARADAARVIATSEALRPVVSETQGRSLVRRMDSRRHRAFVRLRGVVEGVEVAAVVRNDGSVVGTPSLLGRGSLLVAMGEEFDAGQIPAMVGVDPLATALTLLRACDRVVAMELVTGSGIQGTAAGSWNPERPGVQLGGDDSSP